MVPEYYQEYAKDETYVHIWVAVCVYTICPADKDVNALEIVNKSYVKLTATKLLAT